MTVIEQYGRKDDSLEDFLDRVVEAGYNRAHAFAYIHWGLICCLMGRGMPSTSILDVIVGEDPLPIYKLVPCPRDTDGDGDCGQPACPYCHGGARRRVRRSARRRGMGSR